MTYNRTALLEIAQSAATTSHSQLINNLHAMETTGTRVRTWGYHARKLRLWLQDGAKDTTPFSIIADGNSKLGILPCFSTLPVVTCPGAGDCLNWCYSFKSWRAPAAYMRQVQNTILLQSKPGRDKISAEFYKLPHGIKFRLYVDGDFNSVEVLHFWMDTIKTRPDIVHVGDAAGLVPFGYSKSWLEFLELDAAGYEWPTNYFLNISSGSLHGDDIKERMLALPIARGEFVGVKVDHKHIKSSAYRGPDNPGNKEYRHAVLIALNEKFGKSRKRFACPGNCGKCMPDGRVACADAAMVGVMIGVAAH